MLGFDDVKKALRFLCDCKIRAYNEEYNRRFTLFKEGRSSSSDHAVYNTLRNMNVTKDKKLGGMYCNGLEPYIKGIFDSQTSNRENYIDKVKDDIESMYDKINGIRINLNKKIDIKDAIVVYAKKGIWNTPYQKCTIKIENNILSGHGIKKQDYHDYERKVEQSIKRMKQRISSIFEAILRKEAYLEKLKKEFISRSVFGSKHIYKQKDTVFTGKRRSEWKKLFDFKRHSSITISGRNDSPFGNQIIKWQSYDRSLIWKLPNGTEVVFPDYMPSTYTDSFLSVFEDNNFYKRTVAYTIELRIDGKGREYLLVWASFKVKDDGMQNYYTGSGVISVDINVDHIAWSELDEYGNRIAGDVIPMNLTGLSTDQAADVIGRAVRKLTSICEFTMKPLVCEKLDSKGMYRKQKYGNKKKNRIVSQFAFNNIIQTIKSQALRADFTVYEVNPAYTSFIGKTAYMREAGISIHEAASYVIGLIGGLGIYPEVPDRYKELLPKPKKQKDDTSDKPKKEPKVLTERDIFYRNWKSMYSALSGIRTHAFYLKCIPKLKTKKAIQAWFKKNDVIRPEKSYVNKTTVNKATKSMDFLPELEETYPF